MKRHKKVSVWDKAEKGLGSVVTVLAAFYIAGCLAGCLFALRISSGALARIGGEFLEFASSPRKVSFESAFQTAALCLSPALLIFLMGSSPYGAAGISLVFAWVGFETAYGITAICRLPGVENAVLFALALCAGRGLLLTLSVALAGADGFLRSLAHRKNPAGVMLPGGDYASRALFALMPAGLAALWELFLTPRLLLAVSGMG